MPITVPPTPISLPSFSSSTEPTSQKKKLPQIPTPRELVSYYESKGMETNEASMKVIGDLMNVLVSVVSSGNGKKDKFMKQLIQLVILKLNSKPGYGESLAIGVAAGTLVKGIGSVVPHVFGAIGQIWNAVKSSTKA